MQRFTPALRGALFTISTLFGGLAHGLLAGSLTFEIIPGSSVDNVQLGHAAIAAVPALIGFLAGGAVWGVMMGRIAGEHNSRRMMWAGMLGFGPISIILAVGLGIAEQSIVAKFASVGQPIHRVFTLLFVPSAFLIAGISSWAIGKGLRQSHLAWRLSWQVGLTAGITFLVINLIMEAAGWVVGAPGAAERATMLTVLAVGNVGAALIGGGYLGWILSKWGGLSNSNLNIH
ncbi:MAG: hypothetical protein ISR58_00205 [Anaerolineales bacterium]|nr:hypothetical protein [Chloroflexota bacterium]MBL6979584.1 hypothetical protein [Anaerolineales bacterium]